mgnify:CR=1 FL=1
MTKAVLVHIQQVARGDWKLLRLARSGGAAPNGEQPAPPGRGQWEATLLPLTGSTDGKGAAAQTRRFDFCCILVRNPHTAAGGVASAGGLEPSPSGNGAGVLAVSTSDLSGATTSRRGAHIAL